MRETFAFALIAALSGWSVSAVAAEVIKPAINGMIIDTAPNVLQQVQLRTQSFGPGFCQVSVIFAGRHENVLAPPLHWSDWKAIGPAINGGVYSLTFSPECDTGALGQIKFNEREPDEIALDDQKTTCTGDACDFIAVMKRSGCIVLRNEHSRRAVKVKGNNAIPTYVWTVYAQSDEVPKDVQGYCFSDWYRSYDTRLQ